MWVCPILCRLPRPSYTSLERLQVVDRLHLDVPAITLIPALEVLQSSRLVLEGVEQPIQDDLAEPSAILVAQGTTVTNVDVAFPRWDAAWDVLEIALALF